MCSVFSSEWFHSVMYLICGLFCFALLYLWRRELALLMWGATSSPQDDFSWAGQICFASGQQWRAQIQRPLHFSPVLSSFKEKIKVTPLKPASYSSNLFLVSLAAFSIFGALFILLPQHSQRPVWQIQWHTLPVFAHLGKC